MARPSSLHRYEKLQDLLKQARADAGFTQAEVAKRISKPQSYVSKYESGERRLDVVEFVEVAEAIGIKPDELIREL